MNSALLYFKKAQKFFEKKLDKQNKDFYETYLFQARIYVKKNDDYKALQYYLKSLKLLEDYPHKR